jgi:hypothetical protein
MARETEIETEKDKGREEIRYEASSSFANILQGTVSVRAPLFV